VSKRKNANAIDEAFVPHRLSMLVSPAWMVLSLTARRVLDRIEIWRGLKGRGVKRMSELN
jgi:hypothetical protein